MKKLSVLLLILAALVAFVACGEEPTPACEHSFDSGVVTTKASCGTPGVLTITCQKCGHTVTSALPAIPGEHQFNAGVVETAATCSAAGTRTVTCEKCGDTKTETIAVDPNAHNYEVKETYQEATCVNGRALFVCAYCRNEKVDILAAVRDHTYDAGVVSTQPSAFTDGVLLYSCSGCTTTKTEVIPKLEGAALAAKQAEWDAEWNTRFDAVTDPTIRTKLESLYALFDPEKLVTWWASLYDPAVGSFYYSNSARDNAGFLPDMESAYQITNIAKYYGMIGQKYGNVTEIYGPTITQAILNFYYSCECEEDGYFYHPQFPDVKAHPEKYDMRVPRDLEWGDTMIKWLGGKAPYPTALERLASAIAVDPRITAVADVKNQYNDIDLMTAYVKNQIETTGFEGWGNTLSSALEQFRAGGTLNALIDILNSYQDPATGIWGGSYSNGSYYSYSGSTQPVGSMVTMTYKILKMYVAAERTVPYAKNLTDTAVNAALTIEDTARVTYTYNPWATLTQLRTCVKNHGEAGDYDYFTQKIAENAPAMLDALVRELGRFHYDDSSFSYYPGKSNPTIYKTSICLGVAEGDVNGTLLALSSVYNSACYVLGVPQIPMFDYKHADLFSRLLAEAKSPEKSSVASKFYDFEETTSYGAAVVTDPDNAENKVFSVSKPDNNTASNTQPFNLATSMKLKNGDILRVEFDIRIDPKTMHAEADGHFSSFKVFDQIRFSTANRGTYFYMLYLYYDNAESPTGMYIVDSTNNNASFKKGTESKKLKAGQWYHFVVDFDITGLGDGETPVLNSAKTYVFDRGAEIPDDLSDVTPVMTSTNYYHNDNNADDPFVFNNDTLHIETMCPRRAVGDLYLDNIGMAVYKK